MMDGVVWILIGATFLSAGLAIYATASWREQERLRALAVTARDMAERSREIAETNETLERRKKEHAFDVIRARDLEATELKAQIMLKRVPVRIVHTQREDGDDSYSTEIIGSNGGTAYISTRRNYTSSASASQDAGADLRAPLKFLEPRSTVAKKRERKKA